MGQEDKLAENFREWEKNRKTLDKNKERLLKVYDEKTYFIMKDQRIIDSGYDEVALAVKYNSHKNWFILSLNPYDEFLPSLEFEKD